MWWILLACTGPGPGEGDPVTQDTQGPSPSAVVDVVVVGSGPAGLSAAWAARQAGAEVLVLELADVVGPTARYAENYLLVDSQAQRDVGVEDSSEQVLAEWATFTDGGDPRDLQVQAFIQALPELEAWFLAMGASISPPRMDTSAGSTPRVHGVRIGDKSPAEVLAEELAGWVWTEHRATALVEAQGRVTGVRYVDERSGETGWIQAGATVVATGGFARDLELVRARRPELAGLELIFETHPLSSGAGLPLLDQVGADSQNEDSVGVYVHAMADPRPGLEGEALLVPMLPLGLIVDGGGQRLGNEDAVWGLSMDTVLLAAQDQRVWVLLPEEEWAEMDVVVPAYNSAEDRERVPVNELEAAGAVRRYPDIASLSAGEGLPYSALSAVFESYNAMAGQQEDLDFGKDAFLLRPFTGDIVVFEVRPAVAKCYGGARLDLEGRVLDVQGSPVPGLYAAGEVAGMLGSPAIGRGFSGTISAVHWTGLVAGEHAAALAR